MRSYRFSSILASGVLLLAAGNAHAQTVFSGTGGPNSAGVSTPGSALEAFNAFNAAIGGPNNGGTAGTQPSGFRRITWDGVPTGPATGADVTINSTTTGIAPNRFANVGALYDQVYAVAADGFGSVNPGAGNAQNPAFSGGKTFAAFADSASPEFTIEQSFVVPGAGSTTPAFTRGFGAIFTDVELANTSSIEYFNGSTSLGKFSVPVSGNGQFAFLGVLFPQANVSSVKLTLGNSNLFTFNNGVVTPGVLENGVTTDTVATDDFVFAEPVAAASAAPEPGSLALLGMGLFGAGVARRRRRAA